MKPFALILLLTTFACTQHQTSNDEELRVRTSLSHDVNSLAKLITLPIAPDNVSWETINMSAPGLPGPTDWYLLASLHYSADQLAQLVKQSTVSPEPAVLKANEIRPWFSSPLKSNWVASGSQFRSVAQTYKGTPFFKGSLHDGSFVVLAPSNEVLLWLQCCTATIDK